MIERQQELIGAQTVAVQRQNFIIDQLPIDALTRRIESLEAKVDWLDNPERLR